MRGIFVWLTSAAAAMTFARASRQQLIRRGSHTAPAIGACLSCPREACCAWTSWMTGSCTSKCSIGHPCTTRVSGREVGLDNRQLHQRQSRPPAMHRNDARRKADHGQCQPSAGIELSSITRDRTRGPPSRGIRLSLLHQGGSLRSPRAARPPAGPALMSPPRSSPAGARAALTAISRLMPDKRYVVAGAVGSTALRSHFGASLEDHGPNVVLYRAGPQTARRAGSLRGHDHSRQSSATPKPLHRPRSTALRCLPNLGGTYADASALGGNDRTSSQGDRRQAWTQKLPRFHS